MISFSIILVNYNGSKFLYECLDSIKQHVDSGIYEVIIIDNGSTDDSVKIIKEFPSLRLVCSEDNLGFGKANNLAVRHSNGAHLLFLNTDTILLENTPQILSDYLNHHQNVGIVGSRLTFRDGSYQLSCGKLPNLGVEFLYKIRAALDRKWHPTFSKFYNRLYSQEIEVGWVTGACMMVRRDVFEKLGGFDESFFMYFEDVDICKRVGELGLKVVYYPKTSLIHLLGGSGNGVKKEVNTYYRNSQIYYYQKHLGSIQIKILNLYLKIVSKT